MALRVQMLLIVWLASASLLLGEESWKAGVAKADLTPSEALWMAGYASRERPAEAKLMSLWIKVLALEDAEGQRGVILTSDTLGIPQSIYRNVSGTLQKKFGLKPEQVILSASHTHCGPVLRGALYDAYPLDDNQRTLIEKYSARLETNIVEAVGRALADLAPARLASGQGSAGFAVNRRNNPEGKVPQLIEHGALNGPTDHSVPVLVVSTPDGKLKAVLFGYACHNTVMSFYQWSGDYAGFAQIALEKSHSGTTAMFFMGCGGDQNPLPRKELTFAERYGNMLAAAVEEALISPPRTLEPRLRTKMETINLDFGPTPTEAELENMKEDKAESHRRWANRLLAELKSGKPLARNYPYPIQAWTLGNQLLVTLGGEPVVDYSLKFKQQFGTQTWVAGYCNDVMTYIPSLRVLKEGGYEGGGAMIPYGQPALSWGDDVEDLISGSVSRLVQQVRSN
jgi:Neutral/alkaline non-lysosomal ceramidase, N-terminal